MDDNFDVVHNLAHVIHITYTFCVVIVRPAIAQSEYVSIYLAVEPFFVQ